jgi:hypothetical protein
MAGGTLRIEEIKEKRGLIAMSGAPEQSGLGGFPMQTETFMRNFLARIAPGSP